jgi:hypothetical protein
MYVTKFRFKPFCLNYKFFRNDEKRQFYVPMRTESHELRSLWQYTLEKLLTVWIGDLYETFLCVFYGSEVVMM